MQKSKLLRVLALCLLPAMLSGCWSYRSLSDLSIVMGLGIDHDPARGIYKISAEIVDLTKSIKQNGPGAKLVQAEGKTIFDSIREAKRKLLNKLYFGNLHIMVIGEEAARTAGIENAVDWVMRDAEGRETISLAIMQGGTANDLMKLSGLDQTILSLEIDAIIAEDSAATASTVQADLYQVYGMLNSPGVALTLPAFHIAVNDGKEVAESNGLAVFQGDRLLDYLSPLETKYFLIATGKAKGGILAIAQNGAGNPDTSLEIAKSQAKIGYDETDGRFTFHIETETDVYLAETTENIDVRNKDEIQALENEAARRLEMEITSLVKKVQQQMGQDIFGFGAVVHRRDFKAWHEIESRWNEIFRTMPVTVSCKVNIKNTAYISSKEAIRP